MTYLTVRNSLLCGTTFLLGCAIVGMAFLFGDNAQAVFCEHHPMPCKSEDRENDACSIDDYFSENAVYDVALYSRVYATEAQAQKNSTNIGDILTTIGFGTRLLVDSNRSHRDITEVILPYWIETNWLDNGKIVSDGFPHIYNHAEPDSMVAAPNRLFQPAASFAHVDEVCTMKSRTLVLVRGFLPVSFDSLLANGGLVAVEAGSRHPLTISQFESQIEQCGTISEVVPDGKYSIEAYLRVYTAPEYALANSTNPEHIIFTVDKDDAVYSDSYPIDNEIFPVALPVWISESRYNAEKKQLNTVAGITPRVFDSEWPENIEQAHRKSLTASANGYNRIAGVACESVKGYKLVVLETYLYRPKYEGVLGE